MQASITSRRGVLLVLGAAAAFVLLLSIAGPASAAPRWGTTAARGVPAEAVAQPATASGQALTSASVRAAVGHADVYFVMTPLGAWLVGAVGALLLLGGARRYALAQRRGRGGRLAELTGRRPPSAGDQRDRRAA